MTVASKLEPLLSRLFDGAPSVRIRAWDGGETAPPAIRCSRPSSSPSYGPAGPW